MNHIARAVSGMVCLAAFASSQELPPLQQWEEGKAVACRVQVPSGYEVGQWVPLAVVFGAYSATDADAYAQSHGRALAQRGIVAVVPVLDAGGGSGKPPALAPLLTKLRATFRIEQGGMHAVFLGDAHDPGSAARSAVVAATAPFGAEFQTYSVRDLDPMRPDLKKQLQRLPSRRVRDVHGLDAVMVAGAVAGLHLDRRLDGVAGEVARVLDDFHDAAANGDEDRYFAILPDDALFLGTDATERWTGAEFRKFALPYFRRPSAWTYVALQRRIVVEADGNLAMFDEIFDNEAYGECRGSGVLWRRDGRWVLRQYHLTIPVPNDVAKDVAKAIRAFQGQAVASQARSPELPTTLVFVRHAEKVDNSKDPELSPAGKARAEELALVLRDLPVAAVYCTEFRRTQATVAPLCAARGLQAVAVPADNQAAWLLRLRSHSGETVVVAGHSNTVPELLDALGVKDAPAIGDAEFDRMFVVRLDRNGATLLPLRYGR